MNHKSHLKHEYFMAVKNGKKTVDVRLCDAECQSYQVDDTIKFIDIDTEESLIVRIRSLSYYFNIDDLVNDYPVDLLGFSGKSKEEVKAIYDAIYSKEEQETYHVMGIGFEASHVGKD